MNCSELSREVALSALKGWSCSEERGMLRLLTPFRYPDGGIIELFVELRGNQFAVTDFGEAYRFLETSGVEPDRSGVRRQLINLAARLGSANLEDGVFVIVVDEASDVFNAALRLGQVMTRVGDVSLLSKGAVGNTFSDTLVEFLQSETHAVEFRRGELIAGRAASHRVDIVARSPSGTSVIEGLSAVTGTGANAQTAYTIQKFADIAALGANAPRRFAVLDNSTEVWVASLRNQLEQFAAVIDWEKRDLLVAELNSPYRT